MIDRAPSSYLKTFYVDTMVFDPEMLRHLVDLFGADRVLLGTDYPYDMGMEHPVDFIGGTPGIASSDKSKIMGGNAARLLGIGAGRKNRG